MFKYLLLCVTLLFLTVQGCASLPDGARRPEVKVQSVDLGQMGQIPGFYVRLGCQHNSPLALPLRAVHIQVYVNGKLASDYREELKKVQLSPKREVLLTYFAPADKLGAIAQQSLFSPMLSVNAQVKVTLIFEDKDSSDFNPTALYQGVITRGH